MSTMVVHTLHVILAGVWLGGVIFTTAVVSPALKAMKWSEAERVGVRSVIGRHYARAGIINLVLLLVFAVLDGLFQGLGPVFYVEYTLLAVVFGLTAIHGAYFGRKLAELATSERHAGGAEQAGTLAKQRRSLQRVSLRPSQLNLLASVVVVALAVNA